MEETGVEVGIIPKLISQTEFVKLYTRFKCHRIAVS